VIGLTISHYRITRQLGAGGMGVVYEAVDTKLDRTVALKFLPSESTRDPDAKARFVHEAKAASALDHPNVCAIHEIDETDDGQLFIVMASYEGETLKDRIAMGPLPIDEAVDITRQVAEGLAKAHEREIVHRDIKPANIFLTADGLVKILDFGLAKLSTQTVLTKTGTSLGTAGYMSPEQARGEMTDHRTDLWCLGVVLYEMVTGRAAFEADHQAAVAYAVQFEEPQPLARYTNNTTPEMERIIAKAMSKDPALRYQSAADLASDLLRLLTDPDQVRTVTKPTLARRRRAVWVWGVPVGVLIVGAIAVMVLQMFSDGGPLGHAARAEANTLAIMYFENLADRNDPERLGDIATNLLITDLSESQYIRVLSSQRLYDILRLLGMEDVKVIDRETAGEVARHAEVRRMLFGSILRTEPSIVMTSQLVDVLSGEVVGSQRVTGTAGEDIFTLIDRLSRHVRADLELPRAAKREKDVPVATVTTHSEEAYRYYVVGLEAKNKLFHDQAVEAFTRAVEIDSTFAMAWLKLSIHGGVFFETRPTGIMRQALEQAVRYSSRVGRKERRYIAARQAELARDIPSALAELETLVDEFPDEKDAHLGLAKLYTNHMGDFDRSIRHYRRVIEIDPLNKSAYNGLAYRYANARNFEKAVWAVNQYVELAPDEPNPYDSRGDIYAHFGVFDSAMSSYQKAFEINPYFFPSQLMVGGLNILQEDYDRAEEELQKLASAPSAPVRSFGRFLLATIPGHQGKIRQTIAVLDSGLAVDRREGLSGDWRYNTKLAFMARAYLRIGEIDAGLAAYDSVAALTVEKRSILDARWRGFYIIDLARLGRFGEAEEQLSHLEADILELDPDFIEMFYFNRSFVELIRGDTSEARHWAERCLASGDMARIGAELCIALCDLDSGDAAAAAAELEFQCAYAGLGRVMNPFLAVELRYHLARAYEALGEADKASARYEEFLEIWKDADPEIQLMLRDPRDPDNRPLDFARKRLESLAGGETLPTSHVDSDRY